eukprot:TRINITY_DN49749_c0_g2_i1.p1 TRINITY_DN49749_c0_g2~~TRINITY_DN49749_c0_g2_i1.p1  ORF type:complete len:112 (+),score=15.09 TRINITY_DN49749_c0_g2_i1:242-577(+)
MMVKNNPEDCNLGQCAVCDMFVCYLCGCEIGAMVQGDKLYSWEEMHTEYLKVTHKEVPGLKCKLESDVELSEAWQEWRAEKVAQKFLASLAAEELLESTQLLQAMVERLGH